MKNARYNIEWLTIFESETLVDDLHLRIIKIINEKVCPKVRVKVKGRLHDLRSNEVYSIGSKVTESIRTLI